MEESKEEPREIRKISKKKCAWCMKIFGEADHARLKCPALGLNRIIHNIYKYKEGFILVKSLNEGKILRLRALNRPVRITNPDGTFFNVPEYYIVYKSDPVSLPGFKRDMIHQERWIHDDKEFEKHLKMEIGR
jgi:hypothetical protein